MSRPGRGDLLAKVAIVGVSVLLGLALVVQLRSGLSDQAFEDACRSFEVGDSPARAYKTLGADGYRPGCGTTLPCSEADLGGVPVPFACDGADCSMYWRRGDGACLLEFAPRDGGADGNAGFAEMGLTSASWMPLPSGDEE